MADNEFKKLLKYIVNNCSNKGYDSDSFKTYSQLNTAEKNKFSAMYRDMATRHKKYTHSPKRIIKRLVTRDELNTLRKECQDKCAFTNIQVIWSPRKFNTASWDRIDSSKDYTKDNIQLTIWPINRLEK